MLWSVGRTPFIHGSIWILEKVFILLRFMNKRKDMPSVFLRRKKTAWINVYELDENWENWKVLRFDSYNKDWLEFVSKCRMGKTVDDYDIVIGGIANDRVIVTLDRYFAVELSQEETLGLLRFEKPNIQYCIRSERMIKECLTYIESEKI